MIESFFNEYFTLGTNNWATTVKISIKIGFIIGIFGGAVILLKIL